MHIGTCCAETGPTCKEANWAQHRPLYRLVQVCATQPRWDRNTELEFPEEDERASLLSITLASRGMTMAWHGKHEAEEAGRNESMTY